MSQRSVSTTTWTCDLCGATSMTQMAALWAPERSLQNITSGGYAYERCDLCASCVKRPALEIITWFHRREMERLT